MQTVIDELYEEQIVPQMEEQNNTVWNNATQLTIAKLRGEIH